ncbi:type 1 periplasmic-binding domain-containing protein [Advenella mimigardefordensis]|uniref:ABC transporter substrate-binding protein n=1 Tax=Advenella mimigardefordensis TaxID=302406 RepID=UPI00046D2A0F|nr:ABC transporter substrate-binding protein [Advenella mimigardefordensis]
MDQAAETQRFVSAFRSRYHQDPGKVHLVVYEGVNLIAGSMDKAQTANDYSALEKSLRSNTWITPRGTLRFDEKGRAHAPYFYIQQVQGTSLKPVVRTEN